MSDVDKIEKRMSALASSMARILKIGEEWNHESRVQKAVKAKSPNIPALDLMVKYHKDLPLEDLPVRPVCR
jgi:hypothetical protein